MLRIKYKEYAKCSTARNRAILYWTLVQHFNYFIESKGTSLIYKAAH